MTQTVSVLSPHLDDAVLNCCDHLLEWRQAGWNLNVFTVFCSFRTTTVSPYLQEVIHSAGADTVEEFEATRRDEDIQAMHLLNARWQHWDYIDAGFRTHNGAPMYPSYRQLCSANKHPNDIGLSEQIAQSIETHVDGDLILVPLGVGQHADHQILREAAERARHRGQLKYYVDFPYARNPFKWRLGDWWTAVRAKKSVKWTSREKHSILNCYATQIPQLFRRSPFYPEVILG